MCADALWAKGLPYANLVPSLAAWVRGDPRIVPVISGERNSTAGTLWRASRTVETGGQLIDSARLVEGHQAGSVGACLQPKRSVIQDLLLH
jgi:hypothetical protein